MSVSARRLVAGLVMLLSALGLATAAQAHAVLVSTEPGDGSIVAKAPPTVQLHFNEAVTAGLIRLTDALGRSHDDAQARAADDTIVITLPPHLPRGTQVVSYRVLSADGHPVAGSMVFSIGAVTGTAAPAGDNSPNGLIWLARIGTYLGLFVGIGGIFFAAWVAPLPRRLGLIGLALTIGLVSAVASLGLLGLDVLDLPLADLAGPAPWRAAMETTFGPSLLIAIAALTLGLAAQRSPSIAIGRLLSALALASVGLVLSTSGHAATAPPQWLTRPVVFLHGVGVAFWIGALVPLLAMARKPPSELLAVLNRFARVAVPVVGMLVLTGLTLAIVQLQGFRPLIETKYGLILSIKLALVLALLGLAARNRFRFTPALAANPAFARPLARSILMECAVAAAILAVVAGWRFTPPPRAQIASTVPLAIHIHTERAMFQVLVTPGRVGLDDFVLQLMEGDASPLVAREATLTLSLPERGIEPFERKAQLGTDGYWHVAGVPIPYSGRWHIRVEALVTDFEKIALEDEVSVPAR